uniref:Uncharacterized protein n=1 Tax=Rhipicephalus appendiculatus TaxID=34631 RepID=A0A131YCA7_RHIAP
MHRHILFNILRTTFLQCPNLLRGCISSCHWCTNPALNREAHTDEQFAKLSTRCSGNSFSSHNSTCGRIVMSESSETVPQLTKCFPSFSPKQCKWRKLTSHSG